MCLIQVQGFSLIVFQFIFCCFVERREGGWGGIYGRKDQYLEVVIFCCQRVKWFKKKKNFFNFKVEKGDGKF